MSSQPDRPDSSKRRLTPLLPAILPAPQGQTSTESSSGDATPKLKEVYRHKRQAVAAACATCRGKKVKCTAERPKCTLCARLGIGCEYTTNATETHAQAMKRKYDELQSQNTHYEELFHQLQSQPEEQSFHILQRLRAGGDIESLVRQVKDGDLLLQLSLVPETRYRYEFPFSKKMPLSLQAFAQPYVRSSIYEATFLTPDAASKYPANQPQKAQYLRPYHTSTLVDPRLDNIKPSKWTMVSRDDALMRALLRLYLLHEYHWWGCFHKDDFLDDMLSGSERYCSSLLVNVVLAYACHCHLHFRDRYEHWDPHSLGYKFFAEAKRLWEEQSEQTALTTIQADIAFHIMYNMYSMDKIGLTYTVHALAMAHDLKLFTLSACRKDNPGERSNEFTGWSLYWWISLVGYHILIPPLIRRPPSAILPEINEDPEWYGEIWVQYPLTQTLCPTRFGSLFKARMRLSLILNTLSAQLFDNEEGSGVQASSKTAADFMMELTEWHTSLPFYLTPAEIVFPFQLKLHLIYHQIIINLCELSSPSADIAKVDKSSLSNAHSLLAQSKACFETILRMYFLRHGFEYSDTYLIHDLAVLAFMALRQSKILDSESLDTPPQDSTLSDHIRSTIILAAKGLNDQGKNYHVSFALFHIVRSHMNAEDVDILYKWMNVHQENDTTNQMRVRYVHAQYPVNLVNIADHPEKQRLGDFLMKYSNSTMEAK